MSKPIVYVCRGKDCSKEKAALAEVEAGLTEVAEVRRVKCQDICKGPVVGAEVGGRLEWFAKMRKAKVLRRLIEAIRDDRPLSDGLEKRRKAKRSGRSPK